MKSRSAIIVFLFSGILLFTEGCAINPVTGKKQVVLMSEAQEISIGQQSDPEISAFFGVYEDPELQQFITAKGLEMAAVSHRPKLDYHFKVVDSPVINAFAVPGGYVYFTRGIMAHFNNEAEFAGVLGHEIGHVTARHSVIQQRNQMIGQLGMIAGMVFVPELAEFAEPLSQGMQIALLSFGRDAERQSDELGVEYSSRIGYDATEMAGFFNTLERQGAKEGASEIPEFLSTHPSPGERNTTVAKLAEEWKAKLDLTNPSVNRDAYLKKIDGIVLGEDPRQGFLENNVFYHPVLKIQFPTPQDWNFQNTPQQVQMAPKAGDALMSLTLAPGKTPEEATQAFLQQYKLELVESKNETINGLSALLAIADQKQESGTIRVLSAMIQFDGNIYSIMGISELSKFTNYQPVFLSTIRNFKELKEAEKLNRKPEVVRIQTIPQRMTLEAALSNFKMPKARFEELAILNGMLLTDQLEKGTLIKVIGK
ncbi:M48 family metalloprotease [Algoriphagus sp. A40]|uniref:M48 family metalloprotease n=1 Tax=Algoriphagus sp. A40 TaxID=1945863 RepID=UPI000984D924|nr:M48 family metalloprotease [Algoriphagus sp. A40]OOG72990.1 peptidase M48 [Algoriphagus sp. A40]